MAGSVIDKLNKIALWKKAAVLFAFVVALPIYSYYTSWKPIDSQLGDLRAQLVALDQKYKEQKAVADDLVTFQENTKKLEEDLKQALTQLPREKEVPSLLRDIYTLGKKSGVTFKSFQPGVEAPKQLYSELPVKLSMTGSYHEVAVFFDRIGKLSRIVNISELGVTMFKSDKDSDVILSVDCTATTFMFQGKR